MTPEEEDSILMRLKVSHFLALVVIAALSVGLAAGTAVAKPTSATKLSAKQKAQIRAELRKAVKKNPKVVGKRSFLKKASLVNFRLPVTIALRGGNTASNPNSANIDLGASLGQREIDLGGSLAAEIVFHDSFDGGALGNVDIDIRPSATKTLQSTSIPLLWNSDVTGVAYGSGGCQNYNGAAPVATEDIYDPTGTTVVAPGGFPVVPGVDSLAAIQPSPIVGDSNHVGANPTPFPSGSSPFVSPPSAQDTVLRTNALNLEVATPGDHSGFVPDNGPSGDPTQNSQDIHIGKSGGQANLFGNIPGKSYGIDVTVSLQTKIWSILREVDPDHRQLNIGSPWPASALNCRQAYTGYVDNYIPGVRLQGSLKISPAIMPDGKLRIAKATLASSTQEKANIALAACLFPYETYAAAANSSDTAHVTVPTAPINPGATRSSLPNAACNDTPTMLVTDAGVQTLNAPGADYSATSDGSKAVVSGVLDVDNVSADVLIGDV
jgi:hypothetical protein